MYRHMFNTDAVCEAFAELNSTEWRLKISQILEMHRLLWSSTFIFRYTQSEKISHCCSLKGIFHMYSDITYSKSVTNIRRCVLIIWWNTDTNLGDTVIKEVVRATESRVHGCQWTNEHCMPGDCKWLLRYFANNKCMVFSLNRIDRIFTENNLSLVQGMA